MYNVSKQQVSNATITGGQGLHSQCISKALEQQPLMINDVKTIIGIK